MSSRFILPFADVGSGIKPSDGAQLFFFETGSSTPKDTFSDQLATPTPNSNPVIADSKGVFSDIFVVGAYKTVLKDKNDVQIWEADASGEDTLGTFPKKIIGDDETVKGALTDLESNTNINFSSVSTMKTGTCLSGNVVGFIAGQRLSTGATTWEVTATSGVDKIALPTSLFAIPITDVWVDDFILDRSVNVTAAFDEAILLGRKVRLTAGDYFVNDIALPSNFEMEGPRNAILRADTEDSAVFLCDTTSGDKTNIRMKGFGARISGGVTGCAFVRQTSKTNYIAYAIFEDLETFSEFIITYDGFFIFTKWVRGRDGFGGSNPGGQLHQAINSIPAAFGQSKQTNLNKIDNVNFFRSDDADACIDIAYGGAWHITGCDFEQIDTTAIRARGIFGLNINGQTWFEEVRADDVIIATISPEPNAQGTTGVSIDSCNVQLAAENLRFITIGSASNAAITNTIFRQTDAGQLLTSKLELKEFYGNQIVAGDTTTFFTDVVSSRQDMQISNSEMLDTVINSPQSSNNNILPIGPGGLGVSNFTNNGYLSPIDTASAIGLVGQAVRVTNDGTGGALSFEIPSKLRDFLEGKKVTLTWLGYGQSGGGATTVRCTIWEDVTPSNSNGTVSPNSLDSSSDSLQQSSVTVTLGTGLTSLHVGIRNGGAAPNALITIESMSLQLGEVKPEGMTIV